MINHIEHIEDLVFDGYKGALRALQILAGHEIGVTVKVDGSPSIFCGIDPEDKRFFVAKKSIFNKIPKVYKSLDEIENDISDLDLAHKFKVAFEEFSKLGVNTGIYQGDLIFTKDSLYKLNINHDNYLMFHPNTIVYGVLYDSDEAVAMRNADIGVVWHTYYTCDTLSNLQRRNVYSLTSCMNKVDTVWMMNAECKNISYDVSHLRELACSITTVPSELVPYIKMCSNKNFKTPDPSSLYYYIYNRFNSELESKKSEKGKQNNIDKRDRILNLIDRKELINSFRLYDLIVEAKHDIINELNKSNAVLTLIKTKDNYISTNPEGYVCIDKVYGTVVKLVNKKEFSQFNCNKDVVRGWENVRS